MLVKMKRAHWYQGESTSGKYGARKSTRYAPGDVLEMPTSYFEQHIEPYDGGALFNAEVEEAKDLKTGLKKQNRQYLRDLADKHDVEVEGTGSGGTATKGDLVKALAAAGIGVEEDAADDDD